SAGDLSGHTEGDPRRVVWRPSDPAEIRVSGKLFSLRHGPICGHPMRPGRLLTVCPLNADYGQGELQNHNSGSERAIMTIYVHKDCGQPAVETPDVVLPEVATDFPFICLYCLDEIEDELDLMAIEQMSQ